mmetsp:Transcript_31470/g.72410  ORF Transcript_31470/g.72410 Transcript_31470/m.72410 type:complete len:102 (+) Transcript_31470:695-1000(+)
MDVCMRRCIHPPPPFSFTTKYEKKEVGGASCVWTRRIASFGKREAHTRSLRTRDLSWTAAASERPLPTKRTNIFARFLSTGLPRHDLWILTGTNGNNDTQH